MAKKRNKKEAEPEITDDHAKYLQREIAQVRVLLDYVRSSGGKTSALRLKLVMLQLRLMMHLKNLREDKKGKRQKKSRKSD